MWTLKKLFRFEASHQLINHDGRCAQMHGHSWVGEIEVEGNELQRSGPKENMLIDYSDVKDFIDPLVNQLDHTHLNTILNEQMPTSEFLAMWLFNKWKAMFTRDGILLKSVTIKETCTTECKYSE